MHERNEYVGVLVNKECEEYTMITELQAGHVDNSGGKATPVVVVFWYGSG